MHRAGAWQEWQKQVVMEKYPFVRSRDLADLIGRSESAIDHFASRNGIAKDPKAEWAHRSEAKSGSNAKNFKGYRRKTSKGYFVRFLPDHPNASSEGLVMEHRLVAESIIGRYLEKDEVVHHINGIKSDNRPENLMILKFGEHTALHNRRRKK